MPRRPVLAAAGCLWLLSMAGVASCRRYDPDLVERPAQSDGGTPMEYAIACGNGRVDDRELCDTAIASGEAGACPTECSSEDPCFPRVLAGEGCRTECFGLPVTKPDNTDGCCPANVGPGEDSDCGACGDGITGPEETCEPSEKCLRREDCHSPSACLTAVFSGDPATCTSSCRLQLIKSCKHGDGCCPAGCNAETDHDCSASCGNGSVEISAGETCEPGSAVPCRESCDDEIACTRDVLTGSAENCNVTCSNLDIAEPVNGDGCCPEVANAINDSDCLPKCPNQVREGNETCDPCTPGCDDGVACTVDTSTGAVESCDLVCNHTVITEAENGDGCCPSGANANVDADCSSQCGNGVVEPGEDCDGGGRCRDCVQIFDSALVHRYTFDGTGTTVTDTIGTAHGTVVNGSLSGSGTVSLSGGSSGPYVDLPNGLIKSLTNATIEIWITWRGGNAWQRAFDIGNNSNGEGNQGGSATSEWFITPSDDSGRVNMVLNFTSTANDTGSDAIAQSGSGISQGSKHQLVGVFDDAGDTALLYVDGVLKATDTGVTGHLSSIDDKNVWIGRSNYANDELNAIVHEFRVYSAARSAAQVQASFTAGENP